jgi:hypothetical protein
VADDALARGGWLWWAGAWALAGGGWWTRGRWQAAAVRRAHRHWQAGVRAAAIKAGSQAALAGGSVRGGDRSWQPGGASMDAGRQRSSGGGRVLLAATGCVSQEE